MLDQQPQPLNTMVTPPTTPEVSSAPSLPPKKRSHVGRWIAIVSISVLLTGGAAAAAYYYLTVLSVTPEKMMGRMYMAMQGVSSGSVDFTLEGSGTGIPRGPLYTTEDQEYTTPVTSELDVHVNISLDDRAKNSTGTMTFTATTDGQEVTALAGDLRSVGDVDYVQLTKLLAPAIPDEFQRGIDLVLSRWIVIDKNEIAKSLHIDELLEKLQSTSGNAEATAQQDAVNAVIAAELPNAVVITETLTPEDVDGVATVHYAYTIDKNAVGRMLDGIEAATGSEDQFEELRSFLGESGDISGEVWIGKRDALLRKLTATTGMKGLQQFTLSTTLLLSDFNETITVAEPENATPIGDLMLEVLTKVSEDAKADDDGDGLRNSDEDKYETDRNNPDTDGDGYTDGVEVDGGFNPNGEGELRPSSRTEKLEIDDFLDGDFTDTAGLGE